MQSSAPLEHDDKTACADYIRAMPVQEPDPHDVLHLLDDEGLGFASKHPAGELGKGHAVALTEEEDVQEPKHKYSTQSCS